MKKAKLLSFSELFLVAVIWGATFPAAKYALEVLNPVTLTALRFAISSVLFLPVIFWSRKESRLLYQNDFWTVILLGLLGVTLFYIFQFLGLQYTTATNVSLLISLIPIFTSGLAARALKEPLGKLKVLGLVISFLGAGLVITGGQFNLSARGSDLIGAGFIMTNIICWSFYTVLGKKILQKYSSRTVTAHSVVWGTILVIPPALTWGSLGELAKMGLSQWLSVLYLGVLGSFLAYLLWYDGLKRIQASSASTFIYLQPLVTIVVAYFWLGEEVTLTILGGGALILSGVYFAAER
ncbi:MAG: DMT family transporter [Candidatus Acetothermia bacterium]